MTHELETCAVKRHQLTERLSYYPNVRSFSKHFVRI